jgi:HEPN domain-containing protein
MSYKINRNELKKLARLRLKEAEALLVTGNYSGAYYFCGYVVECGLKACIAKQTKRYDFPDKKIVNDSWTHDLIKLVKTASLDLILNQEIRSDPAFSDNWDTVKDWSEESRYQQYSNAQANGIYTAITDNLHGVLRWIEQYW